MTIAEKAFRNCVFYSWFSHEVTEIQTTKLSILLRFYFHDALEQLKTGAHQMEPPSPIQALGVNPFPSRFIIRTVPRGDLARRRWEEPITTTK